MRRLLTALGVAMVIGVPVAHAAVPAATTGGVDDVTASGATLKGSINPNGEATTFYFEYGPSKTYGTKTPVQGPTAAVKQNQAVSAAIGGLAASTAYHYRLVAVNASGTKLGGDKTFKTRTPPPAISLGASSRRVVFGRPTVLSGVFTPSPGKSPAGVKVTLKAGGKAVGNVQTDAAGRFTFAPQTPGVNTSYTAESASNPKATSPALVVGVAFKLTLQLSTAHPKKGKRVAFSGTVEPARTGALVRLQKRVGRKWRTVKTGVLAAGATPAQSSYRVAVRVRRKGTYRVFLGGDLANVAGASRARVIRPH